MKMNYAIVTYQEVYTLLALTTGEIVLTHVCCHVLLSTSTRMTFHAGTTMVMWHALCEKSTSRASTITVH